MGNSKNPFIVRYRWAKWHRKPWMTNPWSFEEPKDLVVLDIYADDGGFVDTNKGDGLLFVSIYNKWFKLWHKRKGWRQTLASDYGTSAFKRYLNWIGYDAQLHE